MKTRSIVISWGQGTGDGLLRVTGRNTRMTGYGNNAPEIEADVLRRAADRFAPGAVLEVDTMYQMDALTDTNFTLREEEAETRPPGVTEPRRLRASVTVHEVRQ